MSQKYIKQEMFITGETLRELTKKNNSYFYFCTESPTTDEINQSFKQLQTCWLAQINRHEHVIPSHSHPCLTGSGRRWRLCLRSAAAYLHQSSQLDREEEESPTQLCHWVRKRNPREGPQTPGKARIRKTWLECWKWDAFSLGTPGFTSQSCKSTIKNQTFLH